MPDIKQTDRQTDRRSRLGPGMSVNRGRLSGTGQTRRGRIIYWHNAEQLGVGTGDKAGDSKAGEPGAGQGRACSTDWAKRALTRVKDTQFCAAGCGVVLRLQTNRAVSVVLGRTDSGQAG